MVGFSIDPGSGQLSGLSTGQGSTMGVRGIGQEMVGAPTSDGNGGWNIPLLAWGRSAAMPVHINMAFTINVSAEGVVSVPSGAHDGFPSFEVWSYSQTGEANLVYHAEEGVIFELGGMGDVRVKNGQGVDN